MIARAAMCRTVRTTLAARVLDTDRVPPWLEGHVGSCLRCQAVVAQARRLRRTLTTMGADHPQPLEGSPPLGLITAGVASVAAAAVLVARARTGRC